MLSNALDIPPDLDALDILFARQSILTEQHRLHGYELLYRGDKFDLNSESDGIGATTELLSNICSCVFDSRMANKPLFINIDKCFIESPGFYPNQSDKVVLELIGTIPATPSIIEKIKGLRRRGFEFALDNYVFEQERAAFLPLVSYVKIDVLSCPPDIIAKNLSLLNPYSVTLVAEKVETMKMFNQCKKLGFTLFQGFHLEHPEPIQGVKLSTSKEITLKLLSELTRPDISVSEITDLIACDTRLALKIVLLVNSSLFSFVREVTNIKEAVVMLGIEAVKRWAVVLLLVSESDAPIELFRTILARAKTLELYAVEKCPGAESEFFTLGLYSGIEAILGLSIASLVNSIPLTRRMKDALVNQSGPLGDMLRVIKQVESFELEVVNEDSKLFLLVNATYWQGLQWADELMEKISL